MMPDDRPFLEDGGNKNLRCFYLRRKNPKEKQGHAEPELLKKNMFWQKKKWSKSGRRGLHSARSAPSPRLAAKRGDAIIVPRDALMGQNSTPL